MSDSTSETKTCPGCGGSIKTDASLCRHCGYVYDAGDHGEPVVAKGAPPAPAYLSLTQLAIPLIVLIAVVAVAATMCQSWRQGRSWGAHVQKLGTSTYYDREFELRLAEEYRRDGMSVDVQVADGVLLVNLRGADLSGLRGKLGAKFGAWGMACVYGQLRKVHGDKPSATAILFVRGQRYSSAECDANKLPRE